MDLFRRRHVVLWLSIFLTAIIVYCIVKTGLRMHRDFVYEQLSKDVDKINLLLNSIEDSDLQLQRDIQDTEINLQRITESQD